MRVFVLLHLRHLDGSDQRKILGLYTAKHEVDAACALLSAADVGGELTVEEHEVRSAGLYGGSAKPLSGVNPYAQAQYGMTQDDIYRQIMARQAQNMCASDVENSKNG